MELLARQASSQELIDHFVQLFRALPMEESTWRARVDEIGATHGSTLDWMEPNQRDAVKDRAINVLAQLLTRSAPRHARFNWEAPEASIAWLCEQDDYTVAKFCLNLLACPFANKSPVLDVRRHGRLRKDLALNHLELATSIHDEEERMFSWPRMRWKLVDWQRHADPFFKALAYSSCLVRASAANALGRIYYGCVTEGRRRVPPLSELLDRFSELERATPGVAGPFLCGCQFRNSPDKHLWSGLDMSSWILDLLRNSAQEPCVPQSQTLSFYAHEIFSDNPSAIKAMLEMGRPNLAVYTATQSPEHLNELRPVLERMAASDNPEVAQSIQTYLARPFHHNGTQFLTEYAFGRMNYS